MQHVVPEVTIPPEVTPENVTTYIVDTGCTSLPELRTYSCVLLLADLNILGTPQDRPHLETETFSVLTNALSRQNKKKFKLSRSQLIVKVLMHQGPDYPSWALRRPGVRTSARWRFSRSTNANERRHIEP